MNRHSTSMMLTHFVVYCFCFLLRKLRKKLWEDRCESLENRRKGTKTRTCTHIRYCFKMVKPLFADYRLFFLKREQVILTEVIMLELTVYTEESMYITFIMALKGQV